MWEFMNEWKNNNKTEGFIGDESVKAAEIICSSLVVCVEIHI